MSQPRRFRSIDSATEVTEGESTITRAHPQYGLFVVVEGDFDPGESELFLRVEVSPDGEFWAPVTSGAPQIDEVMSVTAADLTETTDDDGNPVYVAYTNYHNAPIENARVNILEHSGGFEVTTDLYLSGWTQRGASFEYLVED